MSGQNQQAGGETPPWLRAWQGRQGSQQDQHPWSGQMDRPGGGARPQEPVRTQPTREATDNREGIGRKVLATSPLHDKWNEPQDLMQADPAEVGHILLQLAREHMQNGMFYPEQATGLKFGLTHDPNEYPIIHKQEIEGVLAEGYGWLQAEGLIADALGINGGNGWKIITRKGMQRLEAEDRKQAPPARGQARPRA